MLRKARVCSGEDNRGGEIGVDRVKKYLQTRDSILELKLPYFEGNNPLFYYVRRTLGNLSKLVLISRNNLKAFHIVGYMGRSRYIELFYVVFCSLIFPRASINFELRGGYIQNKGAGRRTLMLVSRLCDIVFTQLDLDSDGKKFVWLPNYFEGNVVSVARNTSVTLGYLGSLTENKGLIELVRAVGNYNRDYGSITLTIGGDGPLMNDLREFVDREQLHEIVFIKGKVGRDDVADFWSNVNFFFFPTSNPYEGQSNALTEAIKAGVIPFASNLPANILTLKYLEHVFEDISAQVINEKIHYWRGNSSLIQTRMCVLNNLYSKERFIKGLKAVYG